MFKKNMNKYYIRKGLTPNFEKDFKNQCPYWDAFVQYKLSEDSEMKTTQTKDNARKKKHFHHLRQGCYPSAIPKWHKMEDDLVARGSYQRLSTSRCEQNISYTLMVAH